jgi:hypothetical protein
VQDCRNTVIPAQAGILARDFNPAFLDSRLRGSDEKTQLALLMVLTPPGTPITMVPIFLTKLA